MQNGKFSFIRRSVLFLFIILNSDSYEDFIEHVCRTQIDDKLGYTLINNLNDLNPIISTNNASIFQSITKKSKI